MEWLVCKREDQSSLEKVSNFQRHVLERTGMICARLQLIGRKSSDTKSSTRLAQSRLPRWMMALIIASLRKTMPVHMITSSHHGARLQRGNGRRPVNRMLAATGAPVRQGYLGDQAEVQQRQLSGVRALCHLEQVPGMWIAVQEAHLWCQDASVHRPDSALCEQYLPLSNAMQGELATTGATRR